jgi:glycosyltransferase involved in cell wall biosynthesis
MKVFICTNILTVIDAAAYVTHCNFWYRLGKNFPKDTFISMTPPRMAIDQARNWAAKMALEQECDYLMFLDDDMLIHPDTLTSLIDANLDIVMAHTYIRGYPFNAMSFYRDANGGLSFCNDWKDRVDENGIFTCDAVGFAVCLIKCSLLSKMEAPYFVTGTGHTEDIYFCCKARTEVSQDVSIGVDTRVPTGHLLHKENVSVENIDRLKEYYKTRDLETAPNNDRGQSYYDAVRRVLGE